MTAVPAKLGTSHRSDIGTPCALMTTKAVTALI
jgi:hypothetical protein